MAATNDSYHHQLLIIFLNKDKDTWFIYLSFYTTRLYDERQVVVPLC